MRLIRRMRSPILGLILTTLAAPAMAEEVCPQIERTPALKFGDIPEPIRRWIGDRKANPGEPWNSTDSIRAGDMLAQYVGGGHMGGDRWLVVWLTGGLRLFRHVEVWQVTPDGGARPIARNRDSISFDKACAEVAAQLATPSSP